jgi:hypothetical protein
VTSKDEDGILVGRVEDAEMQAAAMLGELLCCSASNVMPKTLAVLIKDRDGAVVARVTFVLTRERLT